MLGQDVQGVGWHAHGFDLARSHPLHTDRAADQVGAVFGQQHPAGDLADLVAGPADPLQATGHRRRCLDLDHQIHCAHVDPKLEARGCYYCFESPGLEFIFNLGALLLGH